MSINYDEKIAGTDSEAMEFPLEWVIPDDIVSKHANNIIVQHDESSFYLSFFETRPPIAFNETDIRKIESVKAHCVARIVIPAKKMQVFIDALQSNYNKYQDKIAQGAYD